MKKLLCLLLCVLAFMGCQQTGSSGQSTEGSVMEYAQLLTMEEAEDGIYFCTIANPWMPERSIIRYLLVPEDQTEAGDALLTQLEEQHGSVQLLHTPLDRLALTSTCYGWLLKELGARDAIGAICDKDYLLDEELRQAVEAGTIADGGNSMAPNLENILHARCEALWITPYESASVNGMGQALALPIIYGADYMETSPLGRAEWIRFYGRLVGKGSEADSLFCIVSQRYDSIAHAHPERPVPSRPKLLTDLPYSATWHVPGGCSTMGILYQDAGFDYLWADDQHAGSLALSPEAVIALGAEADIWLIKYNNCGADLSISDLQAQNPLFGEIKAVRERNVFGCNTARINYFDVAPYRPDIILEELSAIAQDTFFENRFFFPLSYRHEESLSAAPAD